MEAKTRSCKIGGFNVEQTENKPRRANFKIQKVKRPRGAQNVEHKLVTIYTYLQESRDEEQTRRTQ